MTAIELAKKMLDIFNNSPGPEFERMFKALSVADAELSRSPDPVERAFVGAGERTCHPDDLYCLFPNCTCSAQAAFLAASPATLAGTLPGEGPTSLRRAEGKIHDLDTARSNTDAACAELAALKARLEPTASDENRARAVAGRIVNEAFNSPSLSYPIIATALAETRAAERERCATIADTHTAKATMIAAEEAAEEIAAAIRKGDADA